MGRATQITKTPEALNVLMADGRSTPTQIVIAGPTQFTTIGVIPHVTTMAKHLDILRLLIFLIPIYVMDVELLCRTTPLTMPN
jgi:hypothetical protein